MNWLLLSLHSETIIPKCIVFYVDISIETPSSLTSSTTSTATTSSTFGNIFTPTPTVPQGILYTINKI